MSEKPAYMRWWNIEHPVFTSTPPATSLALMQQHAGEKIILACEQRQPLGLICGAPGSGKTTILRWISEKLPTATHDALILSTLKTQASAGWLVPRLASWVGVTDQPWSAMVAALTTKLEAMHQLGRQLVVLVDGATRISEEGWDDVTALLDLQSVCGQIISMIFVGDEDFPARLPAQLSSRVSFCIRVPVIDAEVVASIIQIRLRSSQLAENLFDAEAISVLAGVCGSNLHKVMGLAEACLTEASHAKRQEIDAGIVRLAAARSGQDAAMTMIVPPMPRDTLGQDRKEAKADKLINPEKDMKTAPASENPQPALATLFKKDRRGAGRKTAK